MAKNWRTDEGLYEIHEVTKKSHESYTMLATGNEIRDWCKAKEEIYGYVPGLGGDRSYSCWAVLLTYDIER